MTGENQNPVTPDNAAPQFGSDQGTGSTAVFGKDEVERILNQNRHAQDHIKTLESETAAMRAELQALREELVKSKTIDDLLSGIRQPDSNQPGPTAPQIDQERLLKTLKDEIFKDLTAAQQQALERQNWEKSVTTLRERHGDGFATYVDQRAQELNIPVKKLEELAKTSPDAFVELVSPRGPRSAAPTTGSTSAPINIDKETEAYFTKISVLRLKNTPEGREAKRAWDDPDFQRRYRMWVIEKAKKVGSSYGNTI